MPNRVVHGKAAGSLGLTEGRPDLVVAFFLAVIVRQLPVHETKSKMAKP
jgi:hypothetical protein